MEALVDSLIALFALPRNGLASVFIVSFVSATLLPMGSEPAVFGYVKLNPDAFWLTVLVATLGNTLGGMTNYAIGRGAKAAVAPGDGTRYLGWFQRFGARTLLLSWLPVVGDPLCAVAGWLRLPVWPCVAWMALGKLLRYTTMTSALLWIPDDWWRPLISMFTGA
jgi:membrane protein YqaA with SNARE-associated domain